ncbi:FGGY-family carbohydrate kinase [Roseibacterium sp. SDUM158016]|uniref:xylulokinase n=1 Tax=Roseicyclus sediminis TaxID=2980997 RepID=UPI0021D1042C|nr:FGGY family carbohydrate kinase [Roseibacterium sp. SDUM158016]MCU4654683.1 FGGY-family carbohydrate kinase [Roseibacterium sp. SDUM158016]
MATQALILGIDIGTTAVKAVVYDMEGAERHRFARAYPTRRAGAFVEQDPADWMACLGDAFAGIAAEGLAPAIAAIGITSQVNTHVFADDSGRPMHPAITWADTRARAAAAALDATITQQERLAWFGAPMGVDASHMAARMAWMEEAKPEVWAATARVLLPKDWVIGQLTGAHVSDPVSQIGAVGQDGRFVADLFARIEGAAARLPELRDPASVAGTTTLPGADRPVPVATGLMDAWASMFGVGVKAEGDAMYLSGTSEIPGVISSKVHPAEGALVFPPHMGLTLHAAPTQSGGASLAWLCRLFDTDPDTLMAEVAALAPEGPGLLFLPHLSGERAPIWDASARGTFLGLDAGMGRAEMARAVLEGVAMSVRLAFAALDASSGTHARLLQCGGGGFASDTWNQIRSDVLGRGLQRLSARDPGALGAAALASVAAGLQPDLDTALAHAVSFDRTYEPDPRGAARAEALYALYRPAYEAARATNHALAAMG